jgi:spore germination protein GerM
VTCCSRLIRVAVLAVMLAGCGVEPEERAEPVEMQLLPGELRPSAPEVPSAPRWSPVTVYLVGVDGRLVERPVDADENNASDALEALLEVGSPQDGLRNAVPLGTSVRSVRLDEATLTVDLTEQFRSVRGSDQLLACAQLVWTVTEYPAVKQVRIAVAGQYIELPVDGGASTAAPVDRDDYLSVAPKR